MKAANSLTTIYHVSDIGWKGFGQVAGVRSIVIDRRYQIRAVRTFFFLHLTISSLALSAEDPRVPSEVLDTRTVLVSQWTHMSVREQVLSILRYSRDKFYQAPCFLRATLENRDSP